MSSSAVELIVNCYERTYRQVLTPGFFARISERNRRPFARRVAVISNVEDRSRAAGRAAELRATGELDDVLWVDQHRDDALARTGLRVADLGRIAYYSDFALVGLTRAIAPWVLFWDAEVELERPVDWIDPALALMKSDPRILVANPSWSSDEVVGRESLESRPEFALGFGFSDQVFLARTRELAAPIFREWCLASCRYPTAHIAATFEQRLDAYMRNHGRLRATHLGARYRHPERGPEAYRARTPSERLRRRAFRWLVKRLSKNRSGDPRKQIYW